MRLSFRPLPGLTIVTLLGAGLLVWLGTWQYHRLQWKTALLANIEIAAQAQPFTQLSQIGQALEAGDPIDFRRISLRADYVDIAQPFLVFTSQNRNVSWRSFYPVSQNGLIVFSGMEVWPDNARNRAGDDALARRSGATSLAGYVRLAREENRPHTDSTPSKNRWFGFNPSPEQDNWADHIDQEVGTIDMRYYIDAVELASPPVAINANALPAKRPNLRNNHFDYMLTWYGLAVVLLIMYGLFHVREGRLKWR